MSKVLLWMMLTAFTGRPLLSLGLLVVGIWVLDRFTLRFLPSPARWLARWHRGGELARTILVNPHDRRARAELAEMRISQGRHAEAVDLLTPNLEAGDEDVDTLFLLGVAYLGMGERAKGELLLDEAAKLDEDFRMGAIDLERGRLRLKHGDAKGALAALERFVKGRHGTVEGRVLLARALRQSGRDADAALMRDEAWAEYVSAPRFQRRRERMWAWRARPSRPLAYAAIALVAMALGFQVMRQLPGALGGPEHMYPPDAYTAGEDETFE
ncbi:tetratricopeptide repeat protein [Stigmatella hybrida]|uniref:hypothetical protein n=1 Tax=Stigmatella hybrida TaxID=394097 RepID=UPI001CDA68DA|nr:hypothetical protein [Stigmatella hybrida]